MCACVQRVAGSSVCMCVCTGLRARTMKSAGCLGRYCCSFQLNKNCASLGCTNSELYSCQVLKRHSENKSLFTTPRKILDWKWSFLLEFLIMLLSINSAVKKQKTNIHNLILCNLSLNLGFCSYNMDAHIAQQTRVCTDRKTNNCKLIFSFNHLLICWDAYQHNLDFKGPQIFYLDLSVPSHQPCMPAAS